jgi:hypothetical protein
VHASKCSADPSRDEATFSLCCAAMLHAAPDYVLDPHANPRFGAYQGFAGRVDWAGAAGAARRVLRGKRWHFAGIFDEACVVSMAVIDLGWVASAFAYLFDRRERRLVADLSWTGLAGASRVTERPGGAAHSSFHSGDTRLSIDREGESPMWRVKIQSAELELDATLDGAGAPPTLCAIAHPPGAIANCTHKTMGARADKLEYGLSGAIASMDHTSGLLARATTWHWASAVRPGLALNLVEGFNGAVENALWVGDKIVPVGAARFHFDARSPMEPWHIKTDDGAIDLEFRPEGKRAKNQNLLVAASRYVQPIGTFHGTVKPGGGAAPIDVRDWLGVTEDHAARW